MHPPGDGRVTHKIARGLREAGIDVSWVGPGATAPKQDHGIQFHFLPPGGGWSGRFRRRSSLKEAAMKLRGVNVWMGVELDSARIAIQLARRIGGRSVFDVHEVYHDDIVRHRVPPWLFRPASALVRRTMRHLCRDSDLVIGAGITRVDPYRDVIKEAMVVRHCLSASFGHLAPSVPMSPSRECFRVMHGKASLGHGTREVIRGVSEAVRLGSKHLKLVLFRSFVPAERYAEAEITREAADLGVSECIEWRDPVPFDEMFGILRECDLGLIAYQRVLGGNSMPNRVFEYMAMGVPFVFPSYANELVGMLKGWDCAHAVDTEDPKAFGKAIHELSTNPERLRAMGFSARRAFLEQFNMERELKPFIDWIQR
jgi:glycosyltransferase involved in cell wall biosynthesis